MLETKQGISQLRCSLYSKYPRIRGRDRNTVQIFDLWGSRIGYCRREINIHLFEMPPYADLIVV